MYNIFVCILDVNECVEDTDNCSQNCNNTIGSYLCYCNDGHTLDSDDLHTCNGICTDNQLDITQRQCIMSDTVST